MDFTNSERKLRSRYSLIVKQRNVSQIITPRVTVQITLQLTGKFEPKLTPRDDQFDLSMNYSIFLCPAMQLTVSKHRILSSISSTCKVQEENNHSLPDAINCFNSLLIWYTLCGEEELQQQEPNFSHDDPHVTKVIWSTDLPPNVGLQAISRSPKKPVDPTRICL